MERKYIYLSSLISLYEQKLFSFKPVLSPLTRYNIPYKFTQSTKTLLNKKRNFLIIQPQKLS